MDEMEDSGEEDFNLIERNWARRDLALSGVFTLVLVMVLQSLGTLCEFTVALQQLGFGLSARLDDSTVA